MDIRTFNSLAEVECMTKMRNPELGYAFLTGAKMIMQKDIKEIGQDISWYEVTSVKRDGSFSYTPRYGKLEKPTTEEK